MLRKIVEIDEEKCDGCGLCIPNCAEGALQVIDGKARLISDLFCDGLGACIGHCPQDAIEIVEREAEPYDEKKVMKSIVQGGENVIKAHLLHLLDHDEIGYFKEAVAYLKENNILIPELRSTNNNNAHSCPGSRQVEIVPETNETSGDTVRLKSQLKQWPVQFHLMNPRAGYLKNADLLIAADCTAFASANFHEDFLKGKSLVIACPKLDSNKEVYMEKLQVMIDEAEIRSITVLIMEVPCCSGLAHLAQRAVDLSERKVPLKVVVMSIKGEILLEEEI
jgi:Pyruvate/2-oxoacid:ferredoxin oxidoreductase delta subunit